MTNTHEFAEACFDMNSIDELETASADEVNESNATDCREWGITYEQMIVALTAAWHVKMGHDEDLNIAVDRVAVSEGVTL